MADIFSKAKRSEIMSRIKGKETKLEILVRRFLFARGFRYRKNDPRYAGKPDIVLPKYRAIVFVHGCFWHGHENCRAAALPATRKEFWKNKIAGNVERDQKSIELLIKEGWKVIIIWDCEINNEEKRSNRLNLLIEEIKRVRTVVI